MKSRAWFAVGVVAVVVAGGFFAVRRARAEEGEEGGMPKPQAKIEAPLLVGLVGTWNWTASGMMEGSGTTTWTRGLDGTAMFEDLSGKFKSPGGELAFFGHGVWKVAADGKTVTLIWFDNIADKGEVNTGPLTDTSYEVKNAAGDPMSFQKTDTGYELSMHGGAMKIAYTKK